MFELDEYKEFSQPPVLFAEDYGGDIDEFYAKELNNYAWTYNVENLQINEDFQIKGWFWNSSLLPDDEFFQVFKIRPHLIEQVSKKTYINEEGTLVLHYRGTDFKYHCIGWGDVSLKPEYYEKCIEDYVKKHPLKKLVIVSDEPDYITSLLKYETEIIVERNNEFIDWLILLFSKNLICSNSSFCYTAGWFNKNNVYQPNKFFTRYRETEKHFPPNAYYKDSIVL
jgi:hypothetical protein